MGDTIRNKNSFLSRAFIYLFAAALSLISAQADPLDNWTTNQLAASPSGSFTSAPQITAVTYGNGQYVAVGQYLSDFGFVQTSTDGVSWIKRSKDDSSTLDLLDVTFGIDAYGNKLFVAVGWDYFGGRNIYTSTDAINWTSHTTAMANVFGVASGNGLFVAVGDGLPLNGFTAGSTNIYYSFDGTNWDSFDSGVVKSWTDVAYGNGQFVAVSAGYIYPLFAHPKIANSVSGGTVSFCNGLFFISAGPGTNLMSTDGLNWSAVPNNTGAVFSHVIYTSGNYVAISATNAFSSRDGTNWTGRNLQLPSGISLAGLTSGDRNVLVAQGTAAARPVVYLSDPFVLLSSALSFPPQLTISGLTGQTYRIEMTTNLTPANWHALTNFTLTNGPAVWTDLQATDSCRFYRAALLP